MISEISYIILSFPGRKEENNIYMAFGLAFKIFYLIKLWEVLSSKNLMLDIKFEEPLFERQHKCLFWKNYLIMYN